MTGIAEDDNPLQKENVDFKDVAYAVLKLQQDENEDNPTYIMCMKMYTSMCSVVGINVRANAECK